MIVNAENAQGTQNDTDDNQHDDNSNERLESLP